MCQSAQFTKVPETILSLKINFEIRRNVALIYSDKTMNISKISQQIKNLKAYITYLRTFYKSGLS